MSDPDEPLDAALYQPLSADFPCGEDLPREAFVELNELCQGKAGEFNYMTGQEDPPTPPDFHSARPVAMRLLEQTRDIRPISRMVQIEAQLKGAMGLHAGLHLLDKSFEAFWENMHPGPASDTGALNLRRQALQQALDHRKIVPAVEQTTVFNGPGAEGPIRLRDMKIALGQTRARDGEATRDEEGLQEVVRASEGQEPIKKVKKALEGAAEVARSLGNRFAEKFERPVSMGALISELDKLAAACNRFTGEGAPAADAPTPADGAEPAQPGEAPAGPAAQTDVRTDEEAEALLQDSIAYYAVTAPSSPVALILLKVHELRKASFLDWVDATGSGPDKAALELKGVDASRLAEFSADGPAEPEGPDRSAIAADLFNGYSDFKKALSQLKVKAEKAIAAAGSEEAPEQPDFTGAEEKLAALIANIETARELLEAPAASGSSAAVSPGRIKSRRDVKAALESLAGYHQNLDPASPVQTILRRTKSLVDLEYIDILSELSPNGGNLALKMIKGESAKK